MNITINILEKKIEPFFMDNIKEFTKRLSRYCKIQIKQMKKEQELSKISPSAGEAHICICADESVTTSEDFSKKIQDMEIQGISKCQFYINCCPDIEGVEEFSITKLDMAPGLTAAILCEQIYRGYRIMNGQPYHK